MASYDEAKLTTTLRGTFATFNPSTGANQNADSLPTGLVYKLSDGTTLGATVTIDNITTGRYRYSVDVTTGNGFAAGEYYEIWVSAAVTGDTTVTQSTPLCGFKATTSDIDTVDDFLDTEVAAIKAKTDNLPSDPADQSLIIDATTTILGRLPAALESGRMAAALPTATQTQIDNILDGTAWTLASLYGACANPQAADALVQLTIYGYEYSGQYDGLTSAGVRLDPTLSKV